MKKTIVICLLMSMLYVPSASGVKNGIKVMNWNVYIGTDVFAVLNGPITVDEAVEQFIESNPIARMKTIAGHINLLRPDVVFLQEVSQVTLRDSYSRVLGTFDFLEEIKEELDSYELAGVHELTKLTLETESGNASVLDRDVIFVRKGITVEPAEYTFYTALLSLPDPPIEVLRGYTKVRAQINGNPYVLVNTHLEVFYPLRELQAEELASAIGTLSDTVLVGGDFNDVPSSDTYSSMLSAGFTDSWTDKIIGGWDVDGFTCCQDGELRNKFSFLDERIDYLFTLNKQFLTLSGRVIGDRQFNKTLTIPRLWPSDHGGLIFTLYSY